MKKIVILLFLIFSLSLNSHAKDLTRRNAENGLDEISENNLYIEKVFAMYSMEFKKEHPREEYENLIYENDKCVMCGKEK